LGDTNSGKKPIRDPGVKNAPDPGSGSATPLTTNLAPPPPPVRREDQVRSPPDPLSRHVLVHDRAALLDKAEGGGNVRQFCAFLLPLVVFFALLPRSIQRGKTKHQIAYGADFINL
jgi:hypothetical protein